MLLNLLNAIFSKKNGILDTNQIKWSYKQKEEMKEAKKIRKHKPIITKQDQTVIELILQIATIEVKVVTKGEQ